MIPSQLWFSQNFRFKSGSVNQGVVSLDYPFHRLNVFYAVKIISILPLISHEAVWNSTKFGNQGEKTFTYVWITGFSQCSTASALGPVISSPVQ